MLCCGGWAGLGQVDHDLAREQAAALHAAGVQKLIGTDHDVFLDTLGKSSRAQIQVNSLIGGGGGGICGVASWKVLGQNQCLEGLDSLHSVVHT